MHYAQWGCGMSGQWGLCHEREGGGGGFGVGGVRKWTLACNRDPSSHARTRTSPSPRHTRRGLSIGGGTAGRRRRRRASHRRSDTSRSGSSRARGMLASPDSCGVNSRARSSPRRTRTQSRRRFRRPSTCWGRCRWRMRGPNNPRRSSSSRCSNGRDESSRPCTCGASNRVR